MEKQFERILSRIPDVRLITHYPASALTSFRIGGEIAYVLYPRTEEALCGAVKSLREAGMEYRIVGKGSNILARDEPFPGAWVVTRDCDELHFHGHRAEAGCGVPLNLLLDSCAERGLGGLENLRGIPGSVGGAVTMNAGAFGTQFSDILTAVRAYDIQTDRVVCLSYEECGFGYRQSVFQSGRYAVLRVALRCAVTRTDLVRSRMDRVATLRGASQPMNFPSAGSVFRRPAGNYAGKLISEAGLSGVSIGGAQVSEKHAGFIVNRGGATAADVRALIELIRKTVYEKSGILLEPELMME